MRSVVLLEVEGRVVLLHPACCLRLLFHEELGVVLYLVVDVLAAPGVLLTPYGTAVGQVDVAVLAVVLLRHFI